MKFMHVTDKAGDKIAMEKLAEDAAGRLCAMQLWRHHPLLFQA